MDNHNYSSGGIVEAKVEEIMSKIFIESLTAIAYIIINDPMG